MIYLIGGAPKAGKSFLASKIAEQKNGKVIELDSLMPKWNSAVSSKDFSKKLPVWQAKKDKTNPTFNDYQVEAKAYWPEIKSILDSKLNNSGTVVIEGAQLSPRLLRQWLDNLTDSESRKVDVIYLSYSKVSLNDDFKAEAEANGFKVRQRANESR